MYAPEEELRCVRSRRLRLRSFRSFSSLRFEAARRKRPAAKHLINEGGEIFSLVCPFVRPSVRGQEADTYTD